MDTFGMVYLEAMSAGIPIISTNVFAIPEIVGNAGLLVDVKNFSWYGDNYLFAWPSWKKFSDYCEKANKPKVVRSLVKNISLVIDDKKLRTQLGRAGIKETRSGKFSIKIRNKKLRRIYEEAIY
jgi:glycosyltransferase involved in cell wall biosynthesis